MGKVKENRKRNIVYPEVISKPKTKPNEGYLFSKALLHLRKHFTPKELALIFRRSKKFIYKKLNELAPEPAE
jgi:hypothetical protein